MCVRERENESGEGVTDIRKDKRERERESGVCVRESERVGVGKV